MSAMAHTETFYYPVLIREHHLDTFGHVNNATYLEILEEARWEFITARGFGLEKIKQLGMGPTILEWQIKFLKEITLRQEITIESRTLSYIKKIGKVEQIIRNAAGDICCEAVMSFGLFDLRTRKLILPIPEWLHAIGFSGAEGI